MVDTIHDHNLTEHKRIHTFQTGDVIAVFGGVGATLVVGVDAAGVTEVMLRHVGVELVADQFVFALFYADLSQRGCPHDGTATPTERAITALGVNHTIGQVHLHLHRAAVTT
jgi:hypothetical protein